MELIKNAVRQLLRKRGRTWLTVIGIAVGVMMVSVVTVVGAVGRSFVEKELDSMGVSGLSVMALTPTMLISETALQEIRAMPQIKSAMPLMVEVTQVSTVRGSTESVLCGIDAGAGQVISLNVRYGRMISNGDVASAAMVCVLDETLAKEACGRTNAIGSTVTVQVGDWQHDLTVVGVTETGSSLLQNMTSLIPGMVYLPYTTEQAMTGRTDFDQIAIRTVNSDVTESTRQRVEELLGRLYDGSYFRTDNLAMQKDRLGRIVDIVTGVLTVLGGVSLLVSGFGIVTVMLSSVKERTREIGIKKAIGAPQGRILGEFLTEAVLLSAMGAVLGLLPAVILSFVLRVAVSPLLLVGLLVFSVAVGTSFGVYPAYRASKLPPVEALRENG